MYLYFASLQSSKTYPHIRLKEQRCDLAYNVKRDSGEDRPYSLHALCEIQREYNCQEDGVVYMWRAFPDAPAGYMERDGKTESWEECQKRCGDMEQCKGFTWHKGSSRYSKHCSLFSSHSGKITGGRTVSGLKECPKAIKENSGK